MKRFLFFTVVILLFVISCTMKGPTGVIGSSVIQPTFTPSHTPDINYIVNLHAEGTPMPNVSILVTSVNTGVTKTAVTNNLGLAFLKLNEITKWKIDIGAVNGFDNASYIVEPAKEPLLTVNYGIPSLELRIVSGSSLIPINQNQLTLEAKYNTKMNMLGNLTFDLPDGISILPSSADVRNNQDKLTFVMTINKSFEGYNADNKQDIKVKFYNQSADFNFYSNPITIEKNWKFGVTLDYYFFAIYDYPDNGHHSSFYPMIKNINYGTSYNIPFTGSVRVSYVSADFWGEAHPTGINYCGCLPAFTGHTCFDAGAKITTSDNYSVVYDRLNHNGSITVRFQDDGCLDVIRTFSTNYNYGDACMHYDCLLAGVGEPSYISANKVCGYLDPGKRCGMGAFAFYHLWRARYERITHIK